MKKQNNTTTKHLKQNKMNKTKKLIIAFIVSIIGSLLMPIFGQWYEQVTGITPIAFWIVYVFGSIISIVGIATDNFKLH